MGDELVSVEGVGESLGNLVDQGLLDETRWRTAEALVCLKRLIAQCQP